MASITEDEFDALRAYVTGRYVLSGQPPDVVEALDRHNDRVLGFVDEIAAGEDLTREEYEALKTIAILHDVAKADTDLLHHALAGADIAREKLAVLGKDDDFIETVRRGIVCHMGPFPFVDEETEKHAERTGEHLHLPRPRTRIDRLFYDADMLALIDIEGIEKVVVLRRRTPEFVEEDEATAAARGTTSHEAAYASALRSVHRAADTLFSPTAKGVAKRLVDEAEAHVAERVGGRR